ncbi:hypothetical protein CK203_064784 [Vitis vinifera]|uniref:Reverse transcriptase/retrotransposon-derived protein RNase H-like domain-containing protein n=1 Tax=Vitis vinifera TaxID=29760 RepID=A0A438FQ36_VITVI|nr:hypothetical protein CK203_064784 [Vitis vinifera]
MGESYASVPKKSGITVVQNDKGEKFLYASLQVGGPSILLFLGWLFRVFSNEIAVEDQEKTTFTCPFGTMHTECLSAYAMHQQHSKDASKVELIVKLPSPTTVKGVRQFLGHAGFYRRFIKDFSKLARPLCELLLQLAITFEVMCDASDFAIGAVLGQREDGKPYVIYYASKTSKTRKEWKCGSRPSVKASHAHNSHSLPINDDFRGVTHVDRSPWYAHIANYLVTREVPNQITKCVPEQEQQGILSHCHEAHVEATLLLRRQL